MVWGSNSVNFQGVMTERTARMAGVGGELLCVVT